MMRRIRQWLSPPTFADEDRTRIARLLNVTVLTMLASSILYVLVLPFIEPDKPWQLLLIVIVILFSLLLRTMMKRGRLHLASLLIVFGMWSIITLSMLLSGGVYSSSAGINVVFVVAAALLLGGRYGIGVALLSAFSSALILWAGRLGLFELRVMMSPATFWLAQALTFCTVAVLLYLDTQSLEETMRRARAHERALRERNRELESYAEKLELREMALSATQERYRVVSELISDYAYAIEIATDNEINLIWVTDAFARITGYEPEELPTARDWLNLIEPDDLPVIQNWIEASQRGEEHTCDYRIRAKNGKLCWLRNYSKPIDDQVSNGSVQICGAVQNITEQKQGESQQERLLQEISRQREELRALNRRLADVQEMERKNLVRELHDQIGQNLTAIALSLNLIKSQIVAGDIPIPTVEERLNDTLDLVRETTVQTRDVMADLRPPVLDDYGLTASLQWYAERIRERTGLDVKVNCDRSLPRLDPSIENALFRITQEAMTNIVKHAEARSATVVLSGGTGKVLLTIGDDGQGMSVRRQENSAERSGWGLLTMQQRAESIGGEFCIDSQPNCGTVIVVEAPL